jgi:hypothetical protein
MGIEKGGVQGNGMAHDVNPFLPVAVEKRNDDIVQLPI